MGKRRNQPITRAGQAVQGELQQRGARQVEALLAIGPQITGSSDYRPTHSDASSRDRVRRPGSASSLHSSAGKSSPPCVSSEPESILAGYRLTLDLF
jgi:hypothetical protein